MPMAEAQAPILLEEGKEGEWAIPEVPLWLGIPSGEEGEAAEHCVPLPSLVATLVSFAAPF